MLEFDISSIEKAVRDIKKVETDGRNYAEKPYDFCSFKAKNQPFKLAVIDGSNHNKKGAHFLFSAIRTGYQIFSSGEEVERSIDPVVVEFFANNKDVQLGFEAKYKTYYETITGYLPERYPEFEKTPEKIRALLEWQKVKELVETLDQGDVILYDGSLISGNMATHPHFYEAIIKKAKDKGVLIVGFSKDTSLSVGSAPVQWVLIDAAKRHYPGKNWFVSYEENTYFVRFAKETDYVFRLDLSIPDVSQAESVISKIADYCFDDIVAGYPYPMQEVHDAVRISEMQLEECFTLFKEMCVKSGIPDRLFEDLFSLYHDQLDIISFGR